MEASELTSQISWLSFLPFLLPLLLCVVLIVTTRLNAFSYEAWYQRLPAAFITAPGITVLAATLFLMVVSQFATGANDSGAYNILIWGALSFFVAFFTVLFNPRRSVRYLAICLALLGYLILLAIVFMYYELVLPLWQLFLDFLSIL